MTGHTTRGHILNRVVQNFDVHSAWARFLVLGTVQMALIFTITAISVPLPTIAQDLELSPGLVVLAAIAYGTPFSSLVVVGGRVGDARGHQRVLLSGLSCFGACSAAAALAPTGAVLIAARVLQGASAAFVAPAALAMATATFDDAHRQRAQALWGTLSSAGAAAGLVAAGLLATTIGWRAVLLVPVAVVAVAAPVAARLTAAGEPRARSEIGLGGASAATIGIAATSFALTSAVDRSWSSPIVWLSLAIGAGGLVSLVRSERRAAVPILPPYLLASPRWRAAAGSLMAASAAMATAGLFLSLYLQDVQSWGPARTSAALLPLSAVVAMGPIASRLIDRRGARVVTIGGLAATAGGLAILSRASAEAVSVGAIVGGLLIVAVGAGLAFAAGTVAALTQVHAGDHGVAAAVVNATIEIGPVVGLTAFTTVAATRATAVAGYSLAFIAAAITVGGVALVALVTGEGTVDAAASQRSREERP